MNCINIDLKPFHNVLNSYVYAGFYTNVDIPILSASFISSIKFVKRLLNE